MLARILSFTALLHFCSAWNSFWNKCSRYQHMDFCAMLFDGEDCRGNPFRIPGKTVEVTVFLIIFSIRIIVKFNLNRTIFYLQDLKIKQNL